MTDITDQVLWRRMLNHIRADLKGDVYKPLPAIADLDAIESVVDKIYVQDAVANLCLITSVAPDAGKIWILTSISAFNFDGTTGRIQLSKLVGIQHYVIMQRVSVPRFESVDFHNILILNSGEKAYCYFGICAGATNTCHLNLNGYQIDKY